MWYVQAESSHLLIILTVRYSSSEKTASFVSYCLSKPTFTHILGTKGWILMKFSAKWSLCNVDYALYVAKMIWFSEIHFFVLV